MSYSCVTTVLAGAASQALVDLATVKAELGLPTNDSAKDNWFTTIAIPQVSGAIVRYCKRPFAPELVQDAFDVERDAYPYQTPGGFASLQLSRWPVISVVSVVQTLAVGSASNTTNTLVAGKDYRLDAETGQLLRLNPYTGTASLWEALPVTVTYSAGYGVQVSETNAVPGAAPYTVTVQKASTFACDLGVSYANGTALALVTGTPSAGQYAVNSTGVYTFSAADTGQTLTFGYNTVAIPAELAAIALRLITARFTSRGRDPTAMQIETPNVGIQRFWVGNVGGGQFPPEIEDALNDFRVPTTA